MTHTLEKHSDFLDSKDVDHNWTLVLRYLGGRAIDGEWRPRRRLRFEWEWGEEAKGGWGDSPHFARVFNFLERPPIYTVAARRGPITRLPLRTRPGAFMRAVFAL